MCWPPIPHRTLPSSSSVISSSANCQNLNLLFPFSSPIVLVVVVVLRPRVAGTSELLADCLLHSALFHPSGPAISSRGRRPTTRTIGYEQMPSFARLIRERMVQIPACWELRP